ncbi:MAG: right-handed parallel beta-helix repeat-containing protein, partial [Candidatus Heimdallarchaeota archaeon]|nr:right-handed parallel beta-helix repeat-containing protein [Candidatus Heimdallarchaeota archaeon]
MNMGLQGYNTTISSLSIYGDAALDAAALLHAWAGTGTAADPYIIEGYEFSVTSGNIIYLSVTKSTLFRNNYFRSTWSGSTGISATGNGDTMIAYNNTFENVSNQFSNYKTLKFYNNTMINTRVISSASNFQAKENVEFYNNTMQNFYYGFTIATNSITNANVSIYNNTFSNIGYNNVYTYSVSISVPTVANGLIANNTIKNNEKTRAGIKLNQVSVNTIIKDNKFENSSSFDLSTIFSGYFKLSNFAGNTIDGDPIQFYENVAGSISIPANTAQLIISDADSLDVDASGITNLRGVNLLNVSNSQFKNLVITNEFMGISITGANSKNVTIRDSSFSNLVYANKIHHYGGNISPATISLSNNTYTNITEVFTTSYDLYYTVITNNTIENVDNFIDFKSTSAGYYTTISNNTLTNVTNFNIGNFATTYSTFANNTLTNTSSIKVTGINNKFDNNEFHNGGGIDILDNVIYASRVASFTNNFVDNKQILYYADVSNLVITDAHQVYIVAGNNNTISGLNITNTYMGMYIGSTNSSIKNNYFANVNYAIKIRGTGSKIINNTINFANFYIIDYFPTGARGIDGITVSDIEIVNNTLINIRGYGILMQNANNIYITGNNLTSDNFDHFDLSHVGIQGSGNNITITNNLVTNYKNGIALYSSTNSSITFNNVTSILVGMYGIFTNTITNTNIMYNYIKNIAGYYTFYINGGTGSVVSFNDFLLKAVYMASSQTAHTLINNYYSLHTNIDANADGFADTGYTVTGGMIDTQPLATPIFADYPNPAIVLTPTDLMFEEGMTGNTASWTAIDVNPSTYSYTINGGTSINGGSWSSGAAVNINFDGLPVGVHTIVITFVDTDGNSAADTLLINVSPDITQPIVTSAPADTSYELGSTSNSYSWTATDLLPGTHSYTVNGGSAIDLGVWTSGQPNNINFDGLSVGTYTIVVTFYDTTGNQVSDTFVLTVVDTTNPVITTNP